LRESPAARVIIPTTPLDLTSLESAHALVLASTHRFVLSYGSMQHHVCSDYLTVTMHSFGEAMCADHDSLEVLCLNAGRGGAAGDPRDEKDGMESVMLTNVYGHFALVAALMPLLKGASKARIVTQSSGARFRAKPEKVHDLDGMDAAVFNNFDQ
jgi:NAD(P)-dependent dehydrogenase (short-subunit alcohol dehydrogenase family)